MEAGGYENPRNPNIGQPAAEPLSKFRVPLHLGGSFAVALFYGRRFRLLCVLDDFSRELLATVVDYSLSGERVRSRVGRDRPQDGLSLHDCRGHQGSTSPMT